MAAHEAGIQVFVTGGIGGVHKGPENCKSSLVAAHEAGIQVFVTGGIGDVHRGAENCKS